MAESKKNIDKLVDEVLNKHAVSDQEEDTKEIHEQCFFENTPSIKGECVKSTVYTYPRSRLKNEQKNAVCSLFFKDKWGGCKGFWSNKLGVYKSFLAIMLIIILLSVSFVPIITPQDIASSSYPIISSFNVFPDSVNLGDSILLNVSVSDSVGITSVVADIGGLEKVTLSFVEGTIINDTIYSGFWQNTWLVQNIDPGDYTVAVVALNKDNGSVSKQYIFTVLPVDDNINISINNSLEPEFNESSNMPQIEEQNNTILNNNDTIQNEIINSIITQNTINASIDNTTHSELSVSDTNANLSTNITTIDNTTLVNQSGSDIVDADEVFIVDKRHEELTVLPGARFYVERTIDGPHGTNITFVPMFSNDLTLEVIEVVEETTDVVEKNAKINSFNVFDVGKAKNKKENDIEHLKEKLPSETKALNKIAFTDDVKLNSPRKIRLWFRAPSWEEMQSRTKTNSGEISYLIFSNDNTDLFDFEGSTWWSSNWGYRKLITINSSQIDGDLINFPILINITDSDLASKAQSDGDDIAFILYSDNSTKLNHEIELYNGTTGQLISWVNVTSLSGSVDTKIWMYYGNSASTNQQNPTGVWNSDYISVWHINQSGTGSRYDSTSNNKHLTTSGYDGDEKITGPIDGADDLDGTNDYLSTGQNFLSNLGAFTLEGWVRPDSWGSRISLYGQNDVIEFFLDGTNTVSLWTDSGGSTSVAYPYGLSTWHYLVGVGDGTNLRLYFDGPQYSLGGSATSNYGSSTYFVKIGEGVVDASGGLLNGAVDEVRISTVYRSAIWINTCYNNQKNQSTFITVGNKENITDTFIDPISPYIITYSPYTLTATAADILDSVTLWYRYSTNNVSWGSWMENITDTASPWSWNFYFPNGTGYYEFYSIGKLSGYSNENPPAIADAKCYQNASLNTAPSIDLIYPSSNGSTDIVTQPNCQIRVNDKNGDTLNVYWYENSTGSWVLRQTNTSIAANSTISWIYTQANTYNTNYWWKVSVNDSIDNVTFLYYFTTGPINTIVNTITPYIITTSPLGITATGGSDLNNVTLHYRWSDNNFSWATLTYDDFEGATFNWGNYTSGGTGAVSYTGGTYAHQGSNAADIQNVLGEASSFYHTNSIDVHTPGYKYIKIDFWYQAVGMEVGEDFWIRYFDGTTWTTIATYVSGTNFVNGQFYHEIVWINETTYTFPTNMRIRFQCDASSDFDDIYIDEIYVNATTTLGNYIGWTSWSNTSNPDTTYPWTWNFNFPNGIGYYEFYSIGRKSGTANESAPTSADARCYYNTNPPPTIQLITPLNGSTYVNLQPNCQIKANDFNGDTLNVYWYENTTGSWVQRQTNTSIAANSTISWIYTQANTYNTNYWWKVAVNDGFSNISEIYYFTTTPINTSVNTITPYNIITSSLGITATGDSDLSNVTLYYRYSNDNTTWGNITIIGVTSNSVNTNTQLTINKPSGIENGDVLFAFIVKNDDPIITGPAGWTQNTQQDTTAGDDLASGIWYKVVTDAASEPASYTWTGDNEEWSGGIIALRGVNTTYVIDTATVQNAGQDSANPVCPSITTTTNCAMVFTCVGMTGTVSSSTAPAGSTKQFSIYVGTGANGANSLCSNYVQIIPGPTGTKQWTTNGDGTNEWHTYQIAFRTDQSKVGWQQWTGGTNPDTNYASGGWNWTFNFPNGTGYYEFYSIGKKTGNTDEITLTSADARCLYSLSLSPIINNYNLMNSTASKLNNATGLIDVNSEYYFTINVTEPNGWDDIAYINITSWYDNGNDNTTYNQTSGGNLNMFLQYKNTTGTANYRMLWPNNEAQLIQANCTEMIINSYTRIINISFKPLSQIRWACSNNTWNTTADVCNDPYSWNFNITITDETNLSTWKVNEFGVYKYTYILPSQDWVDVYALPGFSDTSNIVTITYSSNYNFNMTIYFEENLYNETLGVTIPIANNVDILADADPNDDINTDITFLGIGEPYAIDIFNESGLFNTDNVSQTVNVQFDVYIPLATLGGKYTARVTTKIIQD